MKQQVNYVEDNRLYYRHIICKKCNCSYDIIGSYKEIVNYKKASASWMTFLNFDGTEWQCPNCKSPHFGDYCISEMKLVPKRMMRALQRDGRNAEAPKIKMLWKIFKVIDISRCF